MTHQTRCINSKLSENNTPTPKSSSSISGNMLADSGHMPYHGYNPNKDVISDEQHKQQKEEETIDQLLNFQKSTTFKTQAQNVKYKVNNHNLDVVEAQKPVKEYKYEPKVKEIEQKNDHDYAQIEATFSPKQPKYESRQDVVANQQRYYSYDQPDRGLDIVNFINYDNHSYIA